MNYVCNIKKRGTKCTAALVMGMHRYTGEGHTIGACLVALAINLSKARYEVVFDRKQEKNILGDSVTTEETVEILCDWVGKT